jgi:glycerol-3-phosphate dehydrogenase
MLTQATSRQTPWDMVIVGGGATGMGVAVDAAQRGYQVLLLEQSDFGKGTSSRSTKLVHGGVRYLEQGNLSLVMEALRERGYLRQNAPHLVSDLAFVVPSYDWWESPFYGLGLKLYNLLAGKYGFGTSQILSRDETLKRIPTLKAEGLRGGVVYYDGQFDDSRLLIHLAMTAADRGATLLNYAQVTGMQRGADGTVDTVLVRDVESGQGLQFAARVVINAAGPFCDSVRQMADSTARPMVAASQGIHLVFDQSFLTGNSAIMVPHTSDGRVMFAIPWHEHTLVGTTDTPLEKASLEPVALEQEIEFILETAGKYLARAPQRSDVLSVFAGIRPLVRSGDPANTSLLSRDHTIHIDHSGLLTITGGKWTTYRHMAEDCVNQAATLARLPDVACTTRDLHIHGFCGIPPGSDALAVYGADAAVIRELAATQPRWAEQLHTSLPYIAAEVIWAVREEMARTIEDVLARRLRALFLNSAAACEMTPKVAALMAEELGWDAARQQRETDIFWAMAAAYRLN